MTKFSSFPVLLYIKGWEQRTIFAEKSSLFYPTTKLFSSLVSVYSLLIEMKALATTCGLIFKVQMVTGKRCSFVRSFVEASFWRKMDSILRILFTVICCSKDPSILLVTSQHITITSHNQNVIAYSIVRF